MPTPRGYPLIAGSDDPDVVGDMNALANAIDADVTDVESGSDLATHAADTTDVHGIPNTARLVTAVAESNLGLVCGIVNANGTIAEGAGFTVAHPSAGVYTITFTTPFTDTCRPRVTPIERDEASLVAAQLAASKFQVRIQQSDGSDVDGAFSFDAYGPIA